MQGRGKKDKVPYGHGSSGWGSTGGQIKGGVLVINLGNFKTLELCGLDGKKGSESQY